MRVVFFKKNGVATPSLLPALTYPPKMGGKGALCHVFALCENFSYIFRLSAQGVQYFAKQVGTQIIFPAAQREV